MSSTLLPEEQATDSHRHSKSSEMRRYGFFPGCVAKESCKELFNSTMLLADKLGIELIELTAASCCGASVVNDTNRDIARVLNARTYAQAEALGLDDVITICSTCTGHMRAANKELLESEARMTQANTILGKFGAKYEGSVMVRHLLWLLIDDIGRAAAQRLARCAILRLPHHSPRKSERLGIGAQSPFTRRRDHRDRRRARRLRRQDALLRFPHPAGKRRRRDLNGRTEHAHRQRSRRGSGDHAVPALPFGA